MSFIPCSDNCFYQKDGYCQLESPGNVTANKESDCAHFVPIPNDSFHAKNILSNADKI